MVDSMNYYKVDEFGKQTVDFGSIIQERYMTLEFE